MLGHGVVDGLPFQTVPGESEWAGWGPLVITYTVYVEEGTVRFPRRFAKQVDAILADPRGWIRGGKVRFRRVEEGANTQCVLAKPMTVDRLCAPLNTEGQVSCNQGTKVVINYERWRHAVPHWTTGRTNYRRMVVQHEFGHRQGQSHRWCQVLGAKAPVMMQQTYSLQGCKCNSWPLDFEL